MAHALGASVGKLNYELKALVELGLVEVHVPEQPGRRQANVYALTERGREAKRTASARVLALRKQEFEQIREEIDELSREVHAINSSDNA